MNISAPFQNMGASLQAHVAAAKAGVTEQIIAVDGGTSVDLFKMTLPDDA